MSLFSGIKFSAAGEGTASASSSSSQLTQHRPAAPSPTPVPVAKRSPSPPAAPDAPAPTSTPAWATAALSLAPRRPKPKANVPTQRTTYIPPAVPLQPSGEGLRVASPKLVDREQQQLGPDGQKLAKAPSMTLAPAIKKPKAVKRNRKGRKIRDKEAAQARAQERGQGQSAKALKRKAKRRAEVVIHTFDPEEPYDPNRPNDLTEYQADRRRERDERRQRLIESKKRKLAGWRSSDETESSDESSEEEVRRDAPKMFAPPRYHSPPARAAPLPPPVVVQAASGDDAYARRLAMSTAATGDDAYARRMALSRDPAPPSFTSAPPPPPPQASYPSSPPQASYPPPMQASYAPPSQDAYPPPPPASFVPPPPGSYPPPPPTMLGGPSMPPFAPTSMPAMPPFASTSDPRDGQAFTTSHPVPIPSFVPRQTFAPSQPLMSAPAPAFVSAARTQPPAPTVTREEDPEAYQKLVDQKMKAAAAVAARLASMAASRPPAPAPIADDPNATFAEKMMRRWGHEEGKGLGTDGSGIVHALSAEHADKSKASKRNKFKPGKPGKWTQAPNAMGKIVNLNADERAKAERDAKGESSRVVCLVGVVEGPEAVDSELADEIGEECNLLGVVERVVLHMVSPPPPEPWKCLRTFVVFSGPAGAWRAIKELDGRYFGGRQIEVTYFDEGRFERGDRDGPLLTTS